MPMLLASPLDRTDIQQKRQERSEDLTLDGTPFSLAWVVIKTFWTCSKIFICMFTQMVTVPKNVHDKTLKWYTYLGFLQYDCLNSTSFSNIGSRKTICLLILSTLPMYVQQNINIAWLIDIFAPIHLFFLSIIDHEYQLPYGKCSLSSLNTACSL